MSHGISIVGDRRATPAIPTIPYQRRPDPIVRSSHQ